MLGCLAVALPITELIVWSNRDLCCCAWYLVWYIWILLQETSVFSSNQSSFRKTLAAKVLTGCLPGIVTPYHYDTAFLKTAVIIKIFYLVSDCFPQPPTPTSRALPRSCRIMRVMRVTCSIASIKNTNFISLGEAIL